MPSEMTHMRMMMKREKNLTASARTIVITTFVP
jgi:hypothetical protein